MADQENETKTSESEPKEVKKPAATPAPQEDVSLEELRQQLLNKASKLVGQLSAPANAENTAKSRTTADVINDLVGSALSIDPAAVALDRKLRSEAPKPKKAKKAKKG